MREAQLQKGELVRFQYGTRTVEGEVKEDRGPIGVNGRHLYLAGFRPERQSASLSLIELPDDELQVVQGAIFSE